MIKNPDNHLSHEDLEQTFLADNIISDEKINYRTGNKRIKKKRESAIREVEKHKKKHLREAQIEELDDATIQYVANMATRFMDLRRKIENIRKKR